MSLRARLLLLCGLAASASLGCARARPTAAAANTPTALSREEYELACAHDPRARLRLYGCDAARLAGPLLVVNGRPVIADSSAAGRALRDSILQSLRGRVLDSISLLQPDSAQRVLGSRASAGALLIWTRRP